jgi:hypothetical protein
MSSPGRQETGGRPLSTADLAAAARPRAAGDESRVGAGGESLAARREVEADTDRTVDPADTGGPDRASEARRAAGEADAPGGSRWFGERAADTLSPDRSPVPADTAARSGGEELEPLFTPETAQTYRSRWISIQSRFVDDPRRAVRSGDELVAQIMTNLADTFAEERQRLEAQLDSTGEGSTEQLRVTLRRYRSFFERLLSL